MTQHHIDDPARELRRVVDRCASYPLARWDAPRQGRSGGAADGTEAADRTPRDLVNTTCQQLADLAADASRRPRREVPALRAHGLADQLSVLTRDALAEAPDEHDQIASLLAELRRAL